MKENIFDYYVRTFKERAKKYPRKLKVLDEILLPRNDATLKERLFSLPKGRLEELIATLERIRERGPVGENLCPHCNHLHNNAKLEYKNRMLFLDRAKQVLKTENGNEPPRAIKI